MRKIAALALALVALTACEDSTLARSTAPCGFTTVRDCAPVPGVRYASVIPLPLLAQASASAAPAQVVQSAPNPVFALQGDYSNPDETAIGDVGTDVVHAFSAGHFLLVGLLLSFGGLVLLRKLAPKGSKLSNWLHAGTGLWIWSTITSIIGVLISSVALAGGSVDWKTLGGLAVTAVGTVLFAKAKDSDPGEKVAVAKAAQAAKKAA